jgi:hypothetical protein
MEYRMRGLPPPLWRLVRQKAGDRLMDVLIGLMRAYTDGKIDPIAEIDPIQSARGKLGGRARMDSLSAAQRSKLARLAATTRWKE